MPPGARIFSLHAFISWLYSLVCFLPQAVKQVYLHFWLQQCYCICMKEKMSGVVVGNTRQCKRVASQHGNVNVWHHNMSIDWNYQIFPEDSNLHI